MLQNPRLHAEKILPILDCHVGENDKCPALPVGFIPYRTEKAATPCHIIAYFCEILLSVFKHHYTRLDIYHRTRGQHAPRFHAESSIEHTIKTIHKLRHIEGKGFVNIGSHIPVTAGYNIHSILH